MNFLFQYKGLWIAIAITMNAALISYDVYYKDGVLTRVKRDKYTYGQETTSGPRNVDTQVDTLHRIIVKAYTGPGDTVLVVDDRFTRAELDSANARFTRQVQDQINTAQGGTALQGSALLQVMRDVLNEQKAQRPD